MGGKMVPKIPRTSKHHQPITDKNLCSLTQNTLCGKTKQLCGRPTQQRLTLSSAETEGRLRIPNKGLASGDTIDRVLKGSRIFKDPTTPFYHSIPLPVSNSLLTFGPECHPKPGVYHLE
jgi:hypothetical protein